MTVAKKKTSFKKDDGSSKSYHVRCQGGPLEMVRVERSWKNPHEPLPLPDHGGEYVYENGVYVWRCS